MATIDSKNLLVWVKAMSRGQALPLDASEIHESLAAAQTYAASAIAYEGQTVKAKLEDGKYHEYILQPSDAGYVLEEVGAVNESDLKQYVQIVDALPESGQIEGILYINNTDGYIWTGSAWRKVFWDVTASVEAVDKKVDDLSAVVDGKSADVEKVNGGFVAVRVPAGICEISFVYKTPGGMLGLIMTVAAAVMLAVYFVVWRFVLRRHARAYVHLYDMDIHKGVRAHNAYISQLSKQIYNCPEKGRADLPDDETLTWPDVERDFIDTSRYDFSKADTKPRTSHITEADEAYRVMQELDHKNDDDIE